MSPEGHSDPERQPAVSAATRRRVLVGSGLLLGAGANTVGSTHALFADSGSADGTLTVDDAPAINYQIVDQSGYGGAAYDIIYDVEWVSDFAQIEVSVSNITDASVSGETVKGSSPSGTLSYPSGGGTDGGSLGDTYEFTFEVFESGGNTVVTAGPVTDDAGGGGTGDGDMGDVDDPELDSYTITDDSAGLTAEYTVDYQLSNVSASNFSEVVVTFDNLDFSSSGIQETSTTQPTGSVTYSLFFGGGSDYTITIDVKNDEGLIVDSATVSDTADGSDP